MKARRKRTPRTRKHKRKPKRITLSTKSIEGWVISPPPRTRKVKNGARDIDPRPIVLLFIKNYYVVWNVVGARYGSREFGRWVRALQIKKSIRHTLLPLRTFLLKLFLDRELALLHALYGMGSRDIDPGPTPGKLMNIRHTLLPHTNNFSTDSLAYQHRQDAPNRAPKGSS